MRRYFSHIKYGFSQVEAKWKRFIINGEPLVFNLERSFKNDNVKINCENKIAR